MENKFTKAGAVAEKFGHPIYETNPSVPASHHIGKIKKVRYGNDQKGFYVDNGSGEILNVGGAAFYEFEEVDDTRFVKMYLAGVKQAAELSKAGLALFEVVYRLIQAKPGDDRVHLSYYTSGLSKSQYYRGQKELLDKGFLFKSQFDGMFFVNITYMFNGDRIAFVKGYRRKGAPELQGELALDAKELADG